ncbi:MAG: hypothetical protein LC793_19850 [Thermomicrobia bacterium]|nr:hypothetical protein [Thermomicrobia bacterium]MCA1725173.1 hypothetical protein [Thermomicrobia bacterium]
MVTKNLPRTRKAPVLKPIHRPGQPSMMEIARKVVARDKDVLDVLAKAEAKEQHEDHLLSRPTD